MLLRANFHLSALTTLRRTRISTDGLTVPYCRTEIFNRSFRVHAARFWNRLQPDIRNAKTLADFKQRLFAYLLAS